MTARLINLEAARRLRSVTIADFYAYRPMHTYLCRATGEMWAAASINAAVQDVPDAKLSAAQWLDLYRAVEQMTWLPGEGEIIADRVITGGGWIERADWRVFNLYRPPTLHHGDAAQAGPWLEHVHRVYPGDADHIVKWFAQRVQHPGDKINHSLVLGGTFGIGKDTLFEPVKHAVGAWNVAEETPGALMGRFNEFGRSVILRCSEARDLEHNRFAFYEVCKNLMAAPPDVLTIDAKHIRPYVVPNCTGVLVTTNFKAGGLYLPENDRRHYVAWSDATEAEFPARYWEDLWGWYGAGGVGHVAAYLATLDLANFDWKAPPPKTDAFYEIVDSGAMPEDSAVADALDRLGRPAALTIKMLDRFTN